MIKTILSFIAAIAFVVGVIWLSRTLFNMDCQIMAGWWGCVLYTYLNGNGLKR